MPLKSEIIVIGSPWMASVMGYSILSAGHRPTIYFVNEPAQNGAPAELPVHVGNGEIYENSRLTFGKEVTQALWDLSGESYKKSKALFARLGLGFTEGRTLWFASNDRQKHLLEETARHNPVATVLKGPEWMRQGVRKFETAIAEPGLRFNAQQLITALNHKFVQQEILVSSMDKLLSIEKLPSMEYRLEFEVSGQRATASAAVVLLLSDRLPVKLFPSVVGKWIPVTLGAFTFKNKTHKEFVQSFFNGGADFAIRTSGGIRLGSFRNLYQDKAVGIHTTADEATRQGVTDFFSGLDFIHAEPPQQTHLTVESLSCDGLPIVGSLSEYPGVHLVAGFAGRTQNFLFEVSELLSRAIVKGESIERLKPFSTKRFV